MSWEKQFGRKLDALWHRRTAKLRSQVVRRSRGRLPAFSKETRRKYTDSLLDLATRILLRREGKADFNAVVDGRMWRQIRGWGLESRFRHILDWAKDRCAGPIVYCFWRHKKCLYVGKGKSWGRLRAYEKSAYFNAATRLQVFCVRGQSNLGKAECLATHLFRPRDNKNKPTKAKWGKACPICKKHDQLRRELTALFRLK